MTKIYVFQGRRSTEDWALGSPAAAAGPFRIFRNRKSLHRALHNDLRSADPPALLIFDDDFEDGRSMKFLSVGVVLPGFPPFFIVSHCNQLETIETCFKLGACDYLLKPLDLNLFKAKIRRILAMTSGKSSVEGPLPLLFDSFALTVSNAHGTQAKLTLKEFQLLMLVHDAFPEGIGRAQICEKIWKNEKVGAKAFDAHLFKLRRKLESLDLKIQYSLDSKYLLKRSYEVL